MSFCTLVAYITKGARCPHDVDCHVQACKLAGNDDVIVKELLPQLLPLFACPASHRKSFGSSLPQGATPVGSASALNEQEDSGYWDLIYILYPELTEAAGSAILRELVPTWPLLERTLEVHT